MFTRSAVIAGLGWKTYHLVERSHRRDADRWLPARNGSGRYMVWSPRQIVLLGLIRDLRVEDETGALVATHTSEVREALYEALMTAPWGAQIVSVNRPPMTYYYRPDWTLPGRIRESAA